MSKGFHRRRSVAASIRQIAVAEIDDALAALADAARDQADRVHAIRQVLKRLRSLIRLPHGHSSHYARENRALRDLGRRLAGTREAEVMGTTFDDVEARAALQLPPALRQQLVDEHVHRANPGTIERILRTEVAAGLVAARRRAERWRFAESGFALIRDGLEGTYRQMRAGGLAAVHLTSAANLHEWRKQVKYHAAHLKWLAAIDPVELAARRRAADTLADVLGEHHDLDVLRAALEKLPEGGGSGASALAAAIADRAAVLEHEAFRLGDELTTESPAQFGKRLAAAWLVWRG